MSELSAKISQLRDAAEQLLRSGRRIDYAAQSAHDALNELASMGLPFAADLHARSQWARYHMANGLNTLGTLSQRLNSAADDIEHAHERRQHTPYAPLMRAAPAVVATIPTGTPSALYSGYISQANAPLLAHLNTRHMQLSQAQTQLNALQQERTTLQEDLVALRHRLYSDGGAAALTDNPAITALSAQINTLDDEILHVQATVNGLTPEVAALEARLAPLLPAQADAQLLAALESTDSPEYLKANTFDCVNYIVQKFHVPPELARDAKHWVTLAAEHSEYGVTAGDAPRVGAVLVMQPEHPYADDVYGHVMYVERIEAGEVWVTDNRYQEKPVRLTEITQETQKYIQYLYFPWHTRA